MLPASRSKECPRMIHWLPRVKTVSNPVKIVWGSNQILKVCQSQRDCVSKPRVARNDLPWGNGSERQNPNGVSALVNVHCGSQPRWGCCFRRLLTPGELVPRNPGLCCGIPLGFKENAVFQNLICAQSFA